ncbi:MAG: hypothetical protein FWD66_10810 [Paludibacter sp.]|nr:hypothetical protein [Paludibacter sp.]
MKKIYIFLLFFIAVTSLYAQTAYYGKINKYSNLYRLSSGHSAILAWLPENTTVFVTSDIAVNGFIPVIYIESGIEGYVYRDATNFTERVAEIPIIPSVSKFIQQTDTVVLTIVNNTLRTLTLKIDNNNYTITGEDQKRIVLTSGQHSYLIFGPKFLPVVGVDTFNKGKNYTWKIQSMKIG